MLDFDKDFWLRGVPFVLAALYLLLLLGSIIIRSIRGTNNWFVRSQEVVKSSLVLLLTIMGVNFLGGPTADPAVFDFARIALGLGSLLGLPFAARYFWMAWRDEVAYWRWRKTGVPESPAPVESLADHDIPPIG